MSEFVNYVNHGAAHVTPRVVEQVIRHLPLWKVEFTQIKLFDARTLLGSMASAGRRIVFIGGCLRMVLSTAE